MRIIKNSERDIETNNILRICLNLNSLYSRIYKFKRISVFQLNRIITSIRELNYSVNSSYNGKIPALILYNIRNGNISHEVAVCVVTTYFLKEIKGSPGSVFLEKETNIILGALLHDIGKSKLNQKVLNKVGKLTDEEVTHIKRHPLLGYEMLNKLDKNLTEARTITLMHHYKLGGYPTGTEGLAVPEYVELISIIDVLCAVLQKRVYHAERKSLSEIFYIMNSNSYKFTIKLNEILIKILPVFEVGDLVITKEGRSLVVTNINLEETILTDIFNMEETILNSEGISIFFIIKNRDDLDFMAKLAGRQELPIRVIQEENIKVKKKLYDKLIENIVT